MSPLYRSRETGKTQFHPVSGLGETFNADEIEATGKSAAKPRVPLGTSKSGVKQARNAQRSTRASSDKETPTTETTGTQAGDTQKSSTE